MQAIILAAGRSSRFNTTTIKLAYPICGQPMIIYPVKLLNDLNIEPTLVLGYQKEVLLSILENSKYKFNYAEQVEQRGTGHAVLCTRQFWNSEDILIINGDMPLIDEKIISKLIKLHKEADATVSFVTAQSIDPQMKGYGRVIDKDNLIFIQEARDFIGNINDHKFINAGIYCVKRKFLENTIDKLDLHNNSGEFYITDLIRKASEANYVVKTLEASIDVVRGINTLKELATAQSIIQNNIIEKHMTDGVRFMLPSSNSIDIDVTIGANTIIGASVQLRNKTSVGMHCNIDAFSIIENSTISDQVTIHSHSVLSDCHIATASAIGPFAHIRNGSSIGQQSVIGNFIEINKTIIGNKTKAKHLGYLGNAHIGNSVNIGAGTITANYNGVTKHTTEIKDHAFVGVNSSLIAPVTIEQNSIIAAGSVITENVPQDALAIARNKQINKENYAKKLKEKYKEAKNNSSQIIKNSESNNILEIS